MKWLRRKKYIIGDVNNIRSRRIKLLLNIKASRTITVPERKSLTEALQKTLQISFHELKSGGDGYTYRIYSDVKSDNPDENLRNIFAEIYGRDLFWCSQCVVAVMRELTRSRIRGDQRYYYSSHIQFAPELLIESEDGALNQLLSERKILRP